MMQTRVSLAILGLGVLALSGWGTETMPSAAATSSPAVPYHVRPSSTSSISSATTTPRTHHTSAPATSIPVTSNGQVKTASDYAQSPSLPIRTAPTRTQHTTVHFRLDRSENAATGTPNGWGQVMWPTTTTAWAWMPPPVRGGQIAHTTDGGKTWSRWLTPKTSWLQLATQGSQTAWFLGETSSGSDAIWLQTSNSGVTWTQWVMRLPPGAAIAGHDITAVFPHPGFDAMGLREDGQFWWAHAGGPWETVWSKTDHVTAVAILPGGGESVALKTAMGTTELRQITVRSTGRVSMNTIGSPPGPVDGMDWITSRDGWIWSSSRIWKTTNGGQSWTALGRIPRGPRISPTITLSMTSRTQGYAAVGRTNGGPLWDASELWSTTNGGRTWSRVKLPTIKYHLPNVTLSLSGFYIAGVTPHILTLWYGPISEQGVPQRIWTSNQGETWHRAKNNPPEPR